MFKKATKEQAKLRLALHGPSGSGKTKSSLKIATAMLAGSGKRIAYVDTERGSASKYAHEFDFDVCEISGNYHPDRCCEAIDGAVDAGYGCIIVDSGTHFWNADGGFLQLVDQEARKQSARGGKFDTFSAWKNVDPVYQRFVQKITSAQIHVIFTLRAKQSYEKVEGQNGKTKIEKMGLAPQMRDDFQYEFDIEGMLNLDHDLAIGKTRCDELDGKVFHKPGKDIADILMRWLTDGAPAVAKPDVRPTVKQTGVQQPVDAQRERDSAATQVANILDDNTVNVLITTIRASTTKEDLDAGKRDAVKMKAALNDTQYAAVKRAIEETSASIQRSAA